MFPCIAAPMPIFYVVFRWKEGYPPPLVLHLDKVSAMVTLVCPACGLPKSPDDFYRDPSRSTGTQSVCKPCMNSKRELRRRRAKKRRFLERYGRKACQN